MIIMNHRAVAVKRQALASVARCSTLYIDMLTLKYSLLFRSLACSIYLPELGTMSSDLEEKQRELQLTRRGWSELVSITGVANYGTSNTLDVNNDGSLSSYRLSNRKNLFYSLGFNVNLNGGDILNQKDRQQIAGLQIEKARLDRQILEQQLRLEVTELYEELQLALKLIELKAQAVESNRIALEITD